MAHRVVFASGAILELILILIRDFEVFLVVILAVTPREIANPPPLAPILAGSMIRFPVGSISHTSKKLEMPAGHFASDLGNNCVLLLL